MHIFGQLAHIFGELAHIFGELVHISPETSFQVFRNKFRNIWGHYGNRGFTMILDHTLVRTFVCFSQSEGEFLEAVPWGWLLEAVAVLLLEEYFGMWFVWGSTSSSYMVVPLSDVWSRFWIPRSAFLRCHSSGPFLWTTRDTKTPLLWRFLGSMLRPTLRSGKPRVP